MPAKKKRAQVTRSCPAARLNRPDCTRLASVRVDLISREYPPEVYGGAGVHLEYLSRDLRRLADVRVHCFGQPRSEPGVTAYPEPAELKDANAALRTMGV